MRDQLIWLTKNKALMIVVMRCNNIFDQCSRERKSFSHGWRFYVLPELLLLCFGYDSFVYSEFFEFIVTKIREYFE